ncbi:hypothetical protein C2G38_2046399 [Gigaspora rosea]|uniref:Peptidase S1 domain-containing protein n=1 Tax=Gigaspora rosea TaxID=44941 RepID=A0A397U9H9_9GLOM|nr:hypothetical protein C2G38_2046399 [Gigaspora rosea]
MVYTLTDMEYNNIVLYFFDNTEFLNDVEPFNPTILYFDEEETPQTIIRSRYDVDNSRREIRKKLLDGDGLYNSATRCPCSAGFWAMSKDEPEPLYIITAGHCINETSYQTYFYYLPWGWNDTQSKLSYIGQMIFRSEDDI